MDILKRSSAPLTEEAWSEIDAQAKSALVGALAGRRVVDVAGPKGWKFSAVSDGTLTLAEETPVEGMSYGTRDVLPLVEIIVPFTMPLWDLDDISRGSKTLDFTPLQEAAFKAAHFEDIAIFHGIEDSGMLGLELEADNEPIEMKLEEESIVSSVISAVEVLRLRSVQGPYALVCPEPLWKKIQITSNIRSLWKRIINVLGSDSKIILSPQYETTMLLSTRGGDNELTIGQDFSIGYQSHTNTEVNLYITETFAFRVFAPEAVVLFKLV